MLKKRIIPIQLLSNNRLVKTRQFSEPRDVGDPVMSSKVYSSQDADELILLNINSKHESIDILVSTVEKISKECFVPLSVGGGIKCLKDAERLFMAGADKVIVNSAIFSNKNLIKEISDIAGTQAVIVGIDVKYVDSGYLIYSEGSSVGQNISLPNHIKNVISEGAGEIFIQSIDRDGEMNGYDIDLLKQVFSESTVPVIAAGGAGNFQDLYEAFKTQIHAVACGSLFNFGDNNPLRAKAYLKNLGVPLKIIK